MALLSRRANPDPRRRRGEDRPRRPDGGIKVPPLRLCRATIYACLLASVYPPTRFSLKAPILSVTALIATPYAFMYDMAALMIPVAFLARDQITRGSLESESEIEVGL